MNQWLNKQNRIILILSPPSTTEAHQTAKSKTNEHEFKQRNEKDTKPKTNRQRTENEPGNQQPKASTGADAFHSALLRIAQIM